MEEAVIFDPTQETWRIGTEDPTALNATVPGDPIEHWIADFDDLRDDNAANDIARARLASAAPDMARVLLAVEWKLRTWCPSCEEYEEHGPDCSLDAALRKAGCR